MNQILKDFERDFRAKFGRPPTPLDLAHNLGDRSEADCMKLMSEFMESREVEPHPLSQPKFTLLIYFLGFCGAMVAIIGVLILIQEVHALWP